MGEADAVPLRVAVVGLNPLGVAVAMAVSKDRGLRLAALVDRASAGKTPGDYGLDVPAGVALLDDVEAIDAIDVAVLCSGPYLDRLSPTLRQLMFKKAHVVTNCEEMLWPWLKHPHLSDILGGEARRAGVSLISVGSDAGLTLMGVPLALAMTVPDVRRVSVRRTIDASGRDAAGRLAIGAGMPVTKFRELVKAERIGRVGVGEAVVLLAQALGRHPMRNDIGVRVDPVFSTADATIEGVRSIATFASSDLQVSVELHTACGQSLGEDRVTVEGARRAEVTTTAGVEGREIVAALLRAAHATSQLKPGLRTILDLPPYRAN